MKIYTKTGDKGSTALIGGKRVLKDHIKIESYGTVDELNSYIGLLRDQNPSDVLETKILIEIQDRLFTLGAHLATFDERGKRKVPPIHIEDVELLEKSIDRISDALEPIRTFVLPGGHQSVSFCHIARCVCRRAERNTVSLSQIEEVDELVLKYLNRLSDYLFALSRKWTKEFKAIETPWIPKK
ncbi:MAG: cob(I)yrinic acid a,c-diamide adenosyltransferase [Flavobacteriales bacterium]